ncbi:cysteine hydrolase family protein [Paraglaciecola aquimarina]|uniref:Cysteine hydrolase family protein n=1 Tax=Paraglaciecola aquimarina TaxID=1235557 RepID=A0ABU3T1X8_9ALTE|nr:cysteine hydrolase family protein [Paraglaciecola aquimarina]MDU0356202.1 cysteine hydrolase family protein [Paraglaciecola aquimarina]
MQRDFLDPEGYFSNLGKDISHLQRTIVPAKKLLEAVRKQSFLVLHTRESHRPELVDLNTNKRLKAEREGAAIGKQGPLGRLLVRGEAGSDFYAGFMPAAGEITIDKPGNSAFYATDLEHILRAQQIRNLVILGVTTDVCVSATMREANDRGFDCLLLEDCCGAATSDLHKTLIDSLAHEGGIFGAHVDSSAFIESIKR